jgi:hypothetical protein
MTPEKKFKALCLKRMVIEQSDGIWIPRGKLEKGAYAAHTPLSDLPDVQA